MIYERRQRFGGSARFSDGSRTTQTKRLRVSDLQIRYRRRSVVEDASFDLLPASMLAIVGRSGSGKSSILRCIAGLQRPTGGSVFVDGTELTRLRSGPLARARRDLFGLVFQQGNLVEELSARDNIRAALDLRRVRASRQRAEDALREFDLGAVADAPAWQLSGGEAQRVAVARVWAIRPPIALLDEPTASLDRDSAGSVADAICMLRDTGSAVLLVTHDRELADRSDTVLQLADGRLVPVTPGAGPAAASSASGPWGSRP